jgi:uncharacterized protein YaeQ
MALKSTIFKGSLNIADMDRNYYADHTLTLARHPSETNERMMIRVLAFALYASESLTFGKGLSTDDEPALWDKDLTGAIQLWIEVGLPDEKLVRRACGRARDVSVLAYGGRAADLWWNASADKLAKQSRLHVRAVAHETSKALAAMADGTLALQCTIQDGEVWMADAQTRLPIEMTTFNSPHDRHS